MSELKSISIQTKLLEGLELEYPNMTLNEMMREISTERNRRSHKAYRDTDVLYAIEQINEYRKDNPKILIEEILEIIKKKHNSLR